MIPLEAFIFLAPAGNPIDAIISWLKMAEPPPPPKLGTINSLSFATTGPIIPPPKLKFGIVTALAVGGAPPTPADMSRISAPNPPAKLGI